MNIGWMKKTLQVEIISKDNGYVFSYTKDWLYKHRNRFEYVFHEVDGDGKDIYYSTYDIADDGTITIETSGGGSGGGSEPLVLTGTYDELTKTITLNKTWNEIKSAYPNVYIDMGENNYASIVGVFVRTGEFQSGYYVTMASSEMGGDLSALLLKASSEDGYPSFSET